MNVPGDSRTFFYYAGVNDLLDASTIDIPGLAAAGLRVFYFGYLNLLAALDRMGPDGRTAAAAVLAEARASGMLTCVDLASSRSDSHRQTVAGTLPEIDYLFLNEIEAERATWVRISDALDTGGMISAARALSEGGVRRTVILHSAAQVIWLEEGQPHVHAPDTIPPEQVISSVGAGDAFAAGVLHGIHENWPREDSIGLGFRAAAACLGGHTATDGLEELSMLLAQ